MSRVQVAWVKTGEADELRRSSQVVAVHGSSLFVFGGEIKPREPVANNVLSVDLQHINGDLVAELSTQDAPAPRVGAAAATLGSKTYIFSGRGGAAMTPLDEEGAIWCFDSNTGVWSIIAPANPSAPTPDPRSYHSLAADGRDTLYLHAGCPASGRLSDFWAFQISTRRWIKLADAPPPARGGTSITFCKEGDAVYRMNGFDGNHEQGGSLDVYNPATDSWSTRTWKADGVVGPGPRSVGSLLCVNLEGRCWLVTIFGESDPSNLGHQGAGKMLDDVWAYDITHDRWVKAAYEDSTSGPVARGWFAAEAIDAQSVVVHGGLNEHNERLGDVWIARFSMLE